MGYGTVLLHAKTQTTTAKRDQMESGPGFLGFL
jgi:hypothetical protein